MAQRIVGRTPWSARVPLDPLFAEPNRPHAIPERPTRGSSADQGVRPTMPNTRVVGEVGGMRGSACPTLALEDKWTVS
jgi:hypothetical protein